MYVIYKLSKLSRLQFTANIINKGGKFLKKLWCCLGRRVYQDNLVLSIELIRFKKMTFWVLAFSSEQLGWQRNCQLLNSSQWWIYIINSADNMKLIWYYIMLWLIPLITLGHLLVPFFVTFIVFHNWFIATQCCSAAFFRLSDFIPDSRVIFSNPGNSIQGRRTCCSFFLSFLKLAFILSIFINPLIAMSDQDRISPYNINTISTR